MSNLRKAIMFLLLMLNLSNTANIFAYGERTHRAISYWTLHHPQSTVDKFLSENLLLEDGLNLKVKANVDNLCPGGCSLEDWLLEGAEHEDDLNKIYNARVFQHFYNPLNSEHPGLSDKSPTIFLDSLTWMWNGGDEDATQYIIRQEDPRIYNERGQSLNTPPEKNPVNLWSWKMARYYYFRSLVNPDSYGFSATNDDNNIYPKYKASARAKTFYALGHVIHLLQDLGQPQHTRNDAHTYDEGAPYEKYCDREFAGNKDEDFKYNQQWENFKNQESIPNFSGISFPSLSNEFRTLDSSIPQQYTDGLPVELRRFWDTDQYTGKAGWKLGSAPLGLAEFSNAFFVTDDTMPSNGKLPNGLIAKKVINPSDSNHQFPFPSFELTDIGVPEDRITNEYKVHLLGQDLNKNKENCGKTAKYIQGGQEINKLISYELIRDVNTKSFYYRMNLCNTNYKAYAEQLLPKTISYSTGLLEYFFRGRLIVNAYPTLQEPNQPGFSSESEDYTITVENATTSKEPLKGADYFKSVADMAFSLPVDELWELSKDQANYKKVMTEKGRQLRKNGSRWYLMEEQPDGNKFPVVAEFYQNERNPEGFTGNLDFGNSFTFMARLKKGYQYTLVFEGTIGNETQNAIAASSFQVN